MARKCVTAACLLGIAFATRAAAAADDSGQPPLQGTLILNERATCRAYYQLDVQKIAPTAMKSEGNRILGEALMSRTERQVKKGLEDRHIDWDKTDWRDCVTVPVEYRNFGGNKAFIPIETITPPPAGDWARPGFDDSCWPRLRKPDAVGSPADCTLGALERNGWVRGAYLRFYFDVPDPATAGTVTFSAEYIGGLRALVNGEEIARGHLPSGALDAETMADEYAYEAYTRTFDELPEKQQERYVARNGGKPLPPTQVVGHSGELTPVGSRLYKIRNRTTDSLTVPAKLLRKGTNVLAIELRPAPLHPIVLKEWFGYRVPDTADIEWEHARLSRLELRSSSAGLPSALVRPGGVQVWAEDITRRVLSPEYLEPGASPGTVRLVGARNGAYAAQVVVGTDKDLAGVKVAVSALRGDAGAALPAGAAAVRGMRPQPLADISSLGEGRIMSSTGGGLYPIYRFGSWNAPQARALTCFAPEATADGKEAAEALKRIQYFDWITSALPESIPADTCQPYWLSVRVPADAAPGVYRGEVRVEASDLPAATLPVEVQVLDWTVPDPTDFRTVVAIEQSPYGVAKQYRTPLWSDEHWRLIESSLRQLARVGNDWWFVPVLLNTEFGNKDGSMVTWIRKRDGSTAFDYAVLDRYLDLIVKHCGPPLVVSFVVMQPHDTGGALVKVLDEASGKAEIVDLGPGAPGREDFWQPFAGSLYNHMVDKGLGQAMYWGYAWDTEGDPALKHVLRRFAPEVFWSCGAHSVAMSGSGGRADRNSVAFYKAVSSIYGRLIGAEAQKGWNARDKILLNTPRQESGALVLHGTADPWAFRIFPERTIFAGYRGTGRMGGDYWAGSYWDGCKVNTWHGAGFSMLRTLWPGPNGAEPSARFEAFREGLQELEARIFVEQALDRGILPPEKARLATEQLARHFKGTFSGGQDWQGRSKAIYALAAEITPLVGLDVDESEFAISVKAQAQAALRVKLRNWTDKPRRWTAEGSAKWIVPARSEGQTVGSEELAVRINGELLKSGEQSAGVLTVTDVASARAYPVKITVRTGRLFETPKSLVLNVASGAEGVGVLQFANLSGKALPWKASNSIDWIRVQPSQGQAAAGEIVALKIVARPPAPADAHPSDLTVTMGNQSRVTHITTYVLQPYRRPARPAGDFVWLQEALADKTVKLLSHTHNGLNRAANDKLPPEKRIQVSSWWEGQLTFSSHGMGGGYRAHRDYYGSDREAVPFEMGGRTYYRGLWVYPFHETTLDLTDSGIRAFSAEVGFNTGMKGSPAGVYFDIYVDGKVRAQSGLMTTDDEPRLLVVDGLAGAKTLRLSTRRDNGLSRDPGTLATWAHPALYGDNLPSVLAETCRKTLEIRRNPPSEPVRRWLVLGPCDANVGGGREGLANASFSDKYKGADGGRIGWTQAAATAEGLAAPVSPPKGNNGAHVFFAVAFDSPKAQAIEMGLGTSNEYAAWLNGEPVFSRSSHLALKANNALHVLGLDPGRNVLLVRIKIDKSPANLILTCWGDGIKAVLPK